MIITGCSGSPILWNCEPRTRSPHPFLTPVSHTPSPRPFPTPVPHARSPHPFPTPVSRTRSQRPFPAPVPHTRSSRLFPTPLPHARSPHPFPTPVPHTRSPRPFPAPVPNARSPHPFPTPVPHTRSPHPFPTPVPHTRSPHPFPTPVLRARLVPAPVPRARSPHPFSTPVGTNHSLLAPSLHSSLSRLPVSGSLHPGTTASACVLSPDKPAALLPLSLRNLSNNRLTGSLPESLTTMTNLVSLDTNTSGLTCPDSYSSCGGKRKPLPPAVIAGIVAGVVVTVALATLLYFHRFDKPLVSSKAAAQVCQEYSLAAVVKATNGWSEANLLGAGAFGSSPTNNLDTERAKIITNYFNAGVFGILMLELITGRHVITNSLAIPSDEEAGQQLHILPWVRRDELVLRVVQLALRCTAKQSATRPAMGVIAAELEAVLVALGGKPSNSAACQVDRQV
ncbi:unnamed protein product [Closterium sp. NIES-64]|nr:unnamed protein product [Closterium sp. NIES-64]